MARCPAAHNPMIWRKVPKPAGETCKACGCFIRAELADKPCEGCAINAFFANQKV